MNAVLSDLVGVPYVLGGTQAGGLDCWNLVRQACRRWHGVALPPVAATVQQGLCLGPALQAARGAGWRPVRASAQPGDVLFMRSPRGLRHVGFVVRERGRLELLHAVAGGSVCQPLQELPGEGYADLRTWRMVR
jgi:cell wall-associated NlpC family hydrolase